MKKPVRYYVSEAIKHNSESMYNLLRLKDRDEEAGRLSEAISNMDRQNCVVWKDYDIIREASIMYSEHRNNVNRIC